MEFRLDESQVELQETVARFCADNYPEDGLIGRENVPSDVSVWRELAAMGVLGLRVPESAGGVGLSTVDAAIVFEQLGAHLAPQALLWSVLVAPYVDGVADGDVIVVGVRDDQVSDGTAVVTQAADAHVLAVLSDDGVVLHRLDGVQRQDMHTLDPISTAQRLSGLGAGEVIGGADVAAEITEVGTVLAAAMLAGVAQRALDVARDYSLEREQFGTPIGSFQAVKHLVADMYVRSVCAQSATYAAAAEIDADGVRANSRSAAAAKLLAAEAAIANSKVAVQVLGGMGFTWDMLPNYLLKRAWALDYEFGTRGDHQLLLGDTLAAGA